MENCVKVLPRKSYNKCGWISLILFVSFGLVVIAIANASKTALQCNPEKTVASDLSTRKYIETKCALEYVKEFNHFLPLHVLFMINFGIVLVLSIIYAYFVKHRVERFADPPSSTTVNVNNVEDQSQPLMSQAALDPIAHQKNSGRYIIFTVYIMHLIICRIIPLVVFAILLLNSSNHPNSFNCPWPRRTKNTLSANLTQKQTINVSTVECTNPVGKQNEIVAASVITVNFLHVSLVFIELVYLLWSARKDDDLHTDMEFASVYILRKRKRIRKLMRKVRNSIPDHIFQFHDDFGKKDLSRRKLEEMYVNVIIQNGRERGLISRKYKNRHETYEAHLQAPQGATVLAITADLFKRTPGMGKHPRTILVVGRPGIGKSFLTKRIFYQWKQQAHEFWQDKIVILIRFRTFNNKKTSLREILRHSDGLNMSSTDFLGIYEYICLKPNNVILIFDGLDELKIDDESLREENTVNSHNEVTHILLIFKQLVKGVLLPGSTVLTTSRPTAEQIYKGLQFDRKVEILGFHEKQIENYVRNFCSNDFDKGTKIWEYIKESPELLSLCYIPVNSYIVCLTLTESIKDDSFEESDHNLQESNVPRTVTELYQRAIKILLYKHHLKYKGKPIPKGYIIAKLPEDLQNDFNKLKEIAWNGMINDNLIFQFQNDDAFVSELLDCGLFNKLEDKRQNFFCFLHLTIQEFLAAQHVVNDMKNVESFISENISEPRWHLVIQFVAGLIGEKIKELKAARNVSERSSKITLTKNKTIMDQICKRSSKITLTENETIIGQILKRFQDWMPKRNRVTGKSNALLVIKCAHEMQDVNVMKSLADEGESCEEFTLKDLNIAPVESTALFEFLSNFKNISKLEIERCVMEHFGFSALGKLLNRNTKITHLNLWMSEVSARGAKPVFDALKNESCTLTTLHLTECNLTDVGVEYLSDALKSENCKLTRLDIRYNKLTDIGAVYLSEALKNENFKITKLDLSYSGLTEIGARYLRDALKIENCKLTKLDASSNKLKDVGIGFLSDALKSENCKLTELDASNNELTDVGAGYLSDALKSENCKLTELNISFNELTDVGAGYLSDALKNENCKLAELNISLNELTNVGAGYLSDALKSENCKLTELNVSGNELTDVRVGFLSNARKSGNC